MANLLFHNNIFKSHLSWLSVVSTFSLLIPLSIRKYLLLFPTKNDCEGQLLIPKFSIRFGSYPPGPLSYLTLLWFLPLTQLSGDYSRSAYLSVNTDIQADGCQHLQLNTQLLLNTCPLLPSHQQSFPSSFRYSPNHQTSRLQSSL